MATATLTEEKRMMKVTARQINEAANSLKGTEYHILYKDWGKQAVDVACKHGGKIEIEFDSALARSIRGL